MYVLVDTNIVTKLIDPVHPQHQLATDAVAVLRKRRDSLFIVPQVLYETWVVGTRPVANNGLGITPRAMVTSLAYVKNAFHLVHDRPHVLYEWERLVETHAIEGKPAHDARLVAAMNVHGLTHLLTFNRRDFTRYPGIVVLDPQVVAATVP